MELWIAWMNIAMHLRQACSRRATFLWMLLAIIAMTIRDDMLGVSSYVRALGLKSKYYNRLLDLFHSNAINIDLLTHVWVTIVLRFFPGIERVNGRLILLGDGIKIAKSGKKMSGVKLLHQDSEDNNKGEFIMGHSCQSVALLIKGLGSFFATPLISRIHEGFQFKKVNNPTLLDKMIMLLDALDLKESFYFVADNYYASGSIINGLLKKGNHLITRVKLNAVAYDRAKTCRRRSSSGRPKLYGTKLHLKQLFEYPKKFITASSPA